MPAFLLDGQVSRRDGRSQHNRSLRQGIRWKEGPSIGGDGLYRVYDPLRTVSFPCYT